jgi:predicted transglutaminase-like cysteine proteinase
MTSTRSVEDQGGRGQNSKSLLIGHADVRGRSLARRNVCGLFSTSFVAGLIAFAVVAFGPGLAQAVSKASRWGGNTGAGTPIKGWVEFCARYRDECAIDPSEPATISLNPETWRTIVTVNEAVNGEIKARTDREHWGVEDRWDLAEDGFGDCEDYQLLKRKRLVDAGFPRRALRMTVAIDQESAGHAVLMVRTDRGDLVLDNKHNVVLSWHATGYVYVKREGHDSAAWIALGGVRSPVATANR